MSDELIVIKPRRGFSPSMELGELWRYRELLFFLVWRDIKVRYKQTIVGAAWAILQPVLQMIIFTIVFGKLAKIPSDDIPYPIFSYSGLLLWTYFAQSLSASSGSIVGSANLITKVYFPRLIIPFSAALAGIVDYFIASIILVAMMFYYKLTPGVQLIFVPLTLIAAFIGATGMGLWLSALNVKYRDIRYVIPYFIQLILFATPVIYPISVVPEKFRWLLALNPMAGVIEAHRACYLGHQAINWEQFMVSLTIGIIIFITGIYYFRSVEREFADVI